MCTMTIKREIPVSFKTSQENFDWLQAQRGDGKLARTLSWVCDFLVDAARTSGLPLESFASAAQNWQAYAAKLEAENTALRAALHSANLPPPQSGADPPQLNEKGAR